MAAGASVAEEPILSRLDRLGNVLRQLEEIKGMNRSPKSSCASSTPSSGTLTSDGHFSSVDFSPRSLEKHCRPIDDVIMEVSLKGTLIEMLAHAEDRLLKLCMQLEEELEAEKRSELMGDDAKKEKKTKSPKKVLKKFVKSCVKGKGKPRQ